MSNMNTTGGSAALVLHVLSGYQQHISILEMSANACVCSLQQLMYRYQVIINSSHSSTSLLPWKKGKKTYPTFHFYYRWIEYYPTSIFLVDIQSSAPYFFSQTFCSEFAKTQCKAHGSYVWARVKVLWWSAATVIMWHKKLRYLEQLTNQYSSILCYHCEHDSEQLAGK